MCGISNEVGWDQATKLLFESARNCINKLILNETPSLVIFALNLSEQQMY